MERRFEPMFSEKAAARQSTVIISCFLRTKSFWV